MKNLILIKFGGSLISDKTKVNKARLDVINDLSRQIKKVLNENKSLSLIIATGAGGFGHPEAQKYENNLEKGRPFIKAAVKKLNKIVVSSLNNAGVSAFSVEPSEIAKYKDGQMTELLYGYIIKLLKKNVIPVFHADLVKDQTRGISILSMDKFLVETAIMFKNRGFEEEKIIFCGKTDGVLDDKGITIPIINQNNFFRISHYFINNKEIDTSGGMKRKVEECLRLINRNIRCLIINGQIKNNLRKAILGKEVIGTKINE
jgi:isopentenyl phosphate kinase